MNLASTAASVLTGQNERELSDMLQFACGSKGGRAVLSTGLDPRGSCLCEHFSPVYFYT